VLFVIAIAIARRALDLKIALPKLLFLSLSYFPAFAWVTYAQTSSVSLLIHAGVLALLLRGFDFRAGLVLGLFVFKPQLAAAIGLALIIARRWRAVLGSAISLGAFVGLGALLSPEATHKWIFGAPQLMAYVRSSATAQRSFGFHSIYGASTLLLDATSKTAATALAVVFWIAGAIALIVLWLRVKWKPYSASWKLAWAATIGASTLLSPHLYFYDLTCMLIAFYLLFDVFKNDLLDDGDIASASVWVWALGFVSPFIAMIMQDHLPFAIQLGTIALFIWSLRVGRRALNM
jgi:hypothetical protein